MNTNIKHFIAAVSMMAAVASPFAAAARASARRSDPRPRRRRTRRQRHELSVHAESCAVDCHRAQVLAELRGARAAGELDWNDATFPLAINASAGR